MDSPATYQLSLDEVRELREIAEELKRCGADPGADRWLKKMVVSRDLRKSRAMRPSAAGRVIT